MLRYKENTFINYWDADEFVRDNFLIEKKSISEKYGLWTVGGIFIEDLDQFNFIKQYWGEANSPCSGPAYSVDGQFEGPDWYFCEESVEDYGMGAKEYSYRLESLNAKKRKFSEFCKKYNDLKGEKSYG